MLLCGVSVVSDKTAPKSLLIRTGSKSRLPASTARFASSRRNSPSVFNRRNTATNSSRDVQGTAPFGALFKISK
jgi:hypothetical protein